VVTALPSRRELRIPPLDGLRGLAACMVLVSPVSNVTGLWGGLLGTGGGQVGVMVFFVLSGYLIAGLYLDRPFTAASVQAYMTRRAARVLPMFYFIVTVALILQAVQSRTGLLVSIYPIPLDEAFWLYAILSGVSVLWTIPVEIHFYLLFIGLWWLRTRYGNVWLGAICVLVMVLYWTAPVRVLDQPLVLDQPRMFPYYLVYFLAGMLVERLLPARRLPALSSAWSWILAPAAVLPFPVLPKHLAGIFLPVRLAVPGRVSADVARFVVRHRGLGLADCSFAVATDPGPAVDVDHGLSRYDFLFDVSSAPSDHRHAHHSYVIARISGCFPGCNIRPYRRAFQRDLWCDRKEMPNRESSLGRGREGGKVL
jgi:peptidoglycan/LPS O-acetylase OafA/YrhL